MKFDDFEIDNLSNKEIIDKISSTYGYQNKGNLNLTKHSYDTVIFDFCKYLYDAITKDAFIDKTRPNPYKIEIKKIFISSNLYESCNDFIQFHDQVAQLPYLDDIKQNFWLCYDVTYPSHNSMFFEQTDCIVRSYDAF